MQQYSNIASKITHDAFIREASRLPIGGQTFLNVVAHRFILLLGISMYCTENHNPSHRAPEFQDNNVGPLPKPLFDTPAKYPSYAPLSTDLQELQYRRCQNSLV